MDVNINAFAKAMETVVDTFLNRIKNNSKDLFVSIDANRQQMQVYANLKNSGFRNRDYIAVTLNNFRVTQVAINAYEENGMVDKTKRYNVKDIKLLKDLMNTNVGGKIREFARTCLLNRVNAI